MLQCCPNGARRPEAHPALPVTPGELAEEVAALAELGITSVHLHPRDVTGAEALAGPQIAATVAQLRSVAPGVDIGVSTGAWIQPDTEARIDLLAGWAGLAAGRPDFASVNVHEDGWSRACAALTEAGIGIELGVFHLDAAKLLRDAGLPPSAVRVLVEVQDTDPLASLTELARLLDALAWVNVPLLAHGEEGGAWPVLLEAARSGLDTRIGLEDVLVLPDGSPADGNLDLVRAARELGAHG
ncbi:MAG TPA: 3-keto-5-aminohexanoate cleavage protein [Pseudonocardiaceae bacterium]|jgi:uncharacterized protein (DUF849 family)|nr:3-keto-5-aminohexanoate cleavage protein [Pseudonocardiaceae bacterium]